MAQSSCSVSLARRSETSLPQPLSLRTDEHGAMSRTHIGDASALLSAPMPNAAAREGSAGYSARGSSAPGAARASAAAGRRSASGYAGKAASATGVAHADPTSGTSSRNATPTPNRAGPPQPTPRVAGASASASAGLNATPRASASGASRPSGAASSGQSSLRLKAGASAATRPSAPVAATSAVASGHLMGLAGTSGGDVRSAQGSSSHHLPRPTTSHHQRGASFGSTTGTDSSVDLMLAFARDGANSTAAPAPGASQQQQQLFRTAEARGALRQTVDSELHLQELVRARRDRAVEVLQMARDEAAHWQARIDATTATLHGEEKRRLMLAAQAREVETEALNLRHRVRAAQLQSRRGGGGGGGGGGGSSPANETLTSLQQPQQRPHSIIRSMLDKYNPLGDDDRGAASSSSSVAGFLGYGADEENDTADAVYAAALGHDPNDFSGGGGSPGAWFSTSAAAAGPGGRGRARRKLTRAERVRGAGKLAEELEKSIRATRFSVESRVAELEASLGEIASLHNQRAGFGATVTEMRERVQALHASVKQAAWLRSCMPLLGQTVQQRETLAEQGNEYGKQVVANLIALNKRDDESLEAFQARIERNQLRPEEVIRLVQEENQFMAREVGEAVRQAEAWRAQMQASVETYSARLRETEAAIDEASKQRRMATF